MMIKRLRKSRNCNHMACLKSRYRVTVSISLLTHLQIPNSQYLPFFSVFRVRIYKDRADEQFL